MSAQATVMLTVRCGGLCIAGANDGFGPWLVYLGCIFIENAALHRQSGVL